MTVIVATHDPVVASRCDRVIRLPFYNELSEDDQARVVAAVLDFST